MKQEYVSTENAPAAVGPYSQAVKVGDFIYTAGQGGLDPATNKMVEGGVSAQAEQTMNNLGAVLVAAGTGFENGTLAPSVPVSAGRWNKSGIYQGTLTFYFNNDPVYAPGVYYLTVNMTVSSF